MADEIGNPNWTKSGMADDIVTRLRWIVEEGLYSRGSAYDDTLINAAAEIERLRVEVERLSESLGNALRLLAAGRFGHGD